jgi:hypothetical protein
MINLLRPAFVLLILMIHTTVQASALPQNISTALDFLTVDYSHVETLQELSQKLVYGLRPVDQKAIRQRIQGLKTVPKFLKTETGFTVSAEGTLVTFDLSQVGRKTLLIDGQRLTINSKRPLAEQIDIFVKNVRLPKSSVYLPLFIDRAEAIAPAVWVVLAFVGVPFANQVVGAIGSGIVELSSLGICHIVVDRWGFKGAPDYNQCVAYTNLKAEKAKRDREAVASVDNKVLIETAGEECPHERTDGKYTVALYLPNQKNWYFALSEGGAKVEKIKLTVFNTGKDVANYSLSNPYAVSKISFHNPEADKVDPKSELVPDKIEVTPGNKSNDAKIQSLQDLHSGIAGRLVKQLIGCDTKKQQFEAAKTRVSEKNSAPEIAR